MIWFHAVSVGEALALQSLVAGLAATIPGARAVISCTTATGLEVARRAFPAVPVLESPYDLSFAVRRFLARVRPALLVLVELELWPNLLSACARSGIPVIVANAKMSERSARGYARALRLLPRFLDPVVRWLPQNEEYAGRLRALGIGPERIQVTGSLKFDNAQVRDPAALRERLRREHRYDASARLLIAGSTHPGEEEAVLEAFRKLRDALPLVRLVLVPRHPERVPRVAGLVQAGGFGRIGFRSRPADSSDPEVLVVDTLGELSMLYALADVAFVGGSLVPVGGHNLLEPAAFGIPLVVGRYLDTVHETAVALAQAGALTVVDDATHLARTVEGLLRDPEASRRSAAGAARVIGSHQGSVRRTSEVIARTLDNKTELMESSQHV